MSFNLPTSVTDQRTGIESPVAIGLEALLITAITRTNQPENFQQIRPRCEIKADIGDAVGRRRFRPSDNILVPDLWSFNLGMQIVTNPENDGVSANHQQLVSVVESFIYSIGQNSWTDGVNWPLHIVSQCVKKTGGQYVLDSEKGYEYSTLGFSGLVAIRFGIDF